MRGHARRVLGRVDRRFETHARTRELGSRGSAALVELPQKRGRRVVVVSGVRRRELQARTRPLGGRDADDGVCHEERAEKVSGDWMAQIRGVQRVRPAAANRRLRVRRRSRAFYGLRRAARYASRHVPLGGSPTPSVRARGLVDAV